MKRMIRIAEDKWVNPRYVVAAVLHEEDGQLILTLTLDKTSGVADHLPDVTGLWVSHVMASMDLTEAK